MGGNIKAADVQNSVDVKMVNGQEYLLDFSALNDETEEVGDRLSCNTLWHTSSLRALHIHHMVATLI